MYSTSQKKKRKKPSWDNPTQETVWDSEVIPKSYMLVGADFLDKLEDPFHFVLRNTGRSITPRVLLADATRSRRRNAWHRQTIVEIRNERVLVGGIIVLTPMSPALDVRSCSAWSTSRSPLVSRSPPEAGSKSVRAHRGSCSAACPGNTIRKVGGSSSSL